MAHPFAHIELQTDDVSQATKFYKSVFDWKLTDMPEVNYTMIDVGKGVGGGMMKKAMPEAPSVWVPYVAVDSVKATIEKAKNAGANVYVEYMAIGDMGAIGVFGDPSGATIGVWEMAKAAKKAPAKKKTARKAPAKKKAAKKPPAKKAPAPAKRAPAKRAPAKKKGGKKR